MSNKPYRVVFMGSPEFAIPSLEALFQDPTLSVVGVVTSPPRPKGRKKTPIPTAIDTFASSLDVPVYYPVSFKEQSDRSFLTTLNPDIIVVAAFGQILPPEVLSIPRFGCINVHASLLPKYRGASPIQAAILDGEKETGITIMVMDEGLDTGSIIMQRSERVLPDDTYETLSVRLAQLGANILVPAIASYINKTVTPQPQSGNATITRIIKKEDGKIDWSTSADVIERKIRAYTPWPGAWTLWKNKRIRIVHGDIYEDQLDQKEYDPGTVLQIGDGIDVMCGNKSILSTIKLQIEGKGIQVGEEFVRGYPDIIGSRLS